MSSPFMESVNYPQCLASPPAIVREAFDEQALAREWTEACADEQDAVTRKQIVLRKALKQWPMVPHPFMKGKLVHSPEMRRFVRDVLGMPDQQRGMNQQARLLLREGGREKNNAAVSAGGARNIRIKNAVVELTTKYRLGADPKQCMDALAALVDQK